jgi:hypothetical protein
MRKTLIAIIAAAPLVAVGASAYAASSTTTKTDDLFSKVDNTPVAAEKAEPLKGVNIKKLSLDDRDSEHGIEHGEMGEGMDD